MAEAVVFDSLNPYENIAYVRGKDPKMMIDAIKSIRTPIKILSIVPYGNGFVAFVMGDVRQNEETIVPNKAKKIKGE